MSFIRSIVVPYDFSQHAERALEMARELARLVGADLHLLHVVQPPAYAYASELYAGGPLHHDASELIELHRVAMARLREIAERDARCGLSVQSHVVDGVRVADAIDEEAERLAADMIVMGTHGRTGLAHLLLGSVAEATLRQAPCPVLTVPLRAERAAARITGLLETTMPLARSI